MRHQSARTMQCAGILFAILMSPGGPTVAAAPATTAPATNAPPAPAAASPAASAAPAWRWTPEILADLVTIEHAAISPDGRLVAYAATRPRAEGDAPGAPYINLHLIGTEGGGARRLTRGDAEDDAPAWSPDGRTIAFLGKRGGAEAKARLYVIPVDGGEAKPLTPEGVEVATFAWSVDGTRLAYIARDPKPAERLSEEKAGRDTVVAGRDERPRRLFVLDRATGMARPVQALGERSAWEIAWSPDGASIAASVTLGPATDSSYLEKRLVALPLAPATVEREIAPRVGKLHDLVWSRDGSRIVWLGGVDRRDPGFGSVFVAPAAGGAPVNLTGDRPETVREILHASGRTIVVAAMQGTGSALVALDAAGGPRRDLLPAGRLAFTTGSASDDGARWALIASTASGPDEIHVVDRRGARRLTDLNPQLATLPRARQETVSWRASDGVTIEGILVRPIGDTGRASWPLVVMVHGGPEYEELDGWGTEPGYPAQGLAERGFFVLRPNYRGSTGRGVAFAKSDQGDLGGRDFQDILDGIDALAPRLRFDKTRVGMLGQSYGGYFANLAATRYSPRFAAAVSRYGISDWISFLGQTDIPVENSEVHWALWCWERHDACWQASPVAHLAKAATPLLILQGDADLRVPKAQSDEMYAALRWAKAPVEYVVFPRETHGVDERAHRIETTRRILDWFERYLMP